MFNITLSVKAIFQKWLFALSPIKKSINNVLCLSLAQAALGVASLVPQEANNAMHVALIKGVQHHLMGQTLLYQVLILKIGGKNAHQLDEHKCTSIKTVKIHSN